MKPETVHGAALGQAQCRVRPTSVVPHKKPIQLGTVLGPWWRRGVRRAYGGRAGSMDATGAGAVSGKADIGSAAQTAHTTRDGARAAVANWDAPSMRSCAGSMDATGTGVVSDKADIGGAAQKALTTRDGAGAGVAQRGATSVRCKITTRPHEA